MMRIEDGLPLRGSVLLRAMALSLVVGACACLSTGAGRRVHVAGGRFSAGLDAQAQSRVLALCRSTAADGGKCTPALWHHEGRVHTVVLADFALDEREVSQARYARCVAAGKCPPLDLKRCVYGDGSRPSLQAWVVLGRSSHPVVCVTFAQAQAYCGWAGGRVPTEVQWERGARGTDGRLFPWGNDWRPDALNWGDEGQIDGHLLTAPVGSHRRGASPYGALDMVGNVWEWAYRVDAFDAEAQPGKQVIRGGGFAAVPHAQRTTKRAPYDAGAAYPNVGFRCAYDGVQAE